MSMTIQDTAQWGETMKLHGMLAVVVGLAGCTGVSRHDGCPCRSEPAEVRPVAQPAGDFAASNPHYKERAGAFYDITYVSPSAAALFKIAAVRPEQMPKVLTILRSFVDEWLGTYVEGNGSITPVEVADCVGRMDKRFDALFDDLQRRQYRIWRDDATGEHNKLRFLMSAPPAPRAGDPRPSPPSDSPGKVRQ